MTVDDLQDLSKNLGRAGNQIVGFHIARTARKVTDDKFSAAMSEFGGQVLKSSLSEQDEQELMAELGTPTQ